MLMRHGGRAAPKTRFWRLKAESTCQHLQTPIRRLSLAFAGMPWVTRRSASLTCS
jgi:hypothetical protein